MSITAQDDTQTRPADQAGRGARVRLWLTWARSYFSVPRWWLELAVIYSIYRVYSYIRNLGGKDVEPAFRHGTAVLDLEKKLHIDIEMALNKFGENFTIVRDIASLHYHTLHWWMTIGTAVWLFVTNKAGYRRGSFVLILTTLGALAGFYMMPTAPPRMYDGFVDTLAQTSSWGWWSPSGSPGPESLSNQFAAMPSLHCGWAIWCGLMIFLYARRTWVRVLGVCYPISTILVVMITANHYLLDAVAIMAVIAVSVAIVYTPWSAVLAQVFGREDVRAVTLEAAGTEEVVVPGVLPQISPAFATEESDR